MEGLIAGISRSTAIALVVMALGGGTSAAGQSLRTVPTTHWTYEVADALLLRHPELGEVVWVANRPWREAEFRALVERAGELGLGEGAPRVARWVAMLEAEYRPPATAGPDDLALDIYNEATLSYRGSARTDDATFEPAFQGTRIDAPDGEPGNRLVGRHDLAIQYRDRFALVTGYVVDQNVRNDPALSRLGGFRIGSDKDEFGVVFLDAYGAFEAGPVYARIGRAAMSLGPGRGASVFLSDSISPLDQARVEVDLDPVRLTGLVGRLSGDRQDRSLDDEGRVIPGSDPPESGARSVDRIVYLHRVEWRWKRWIQAAVSEAVLSTGFDRGVEAEFASMVVPFAFFADDERRSFLLGGEIVAWPVPGVEAYVGAVVQEGDELDDQRAWRVGGRWADPPGAAGVTVGAEYTRADERMYLDPGLNTAWTTFGAPVGSTLGPDADQAYGWIEYWPAATVRLTADLLRRRRGERSLADPGEFDRGDGEFPTGTVERQWRAGLEGWWNAPEPGLEGFARVDRRTVDNLGNAGGRDDAFWELRVGLRYRWTSRIR